MTETNPGVPPSGTIAINFDATPDKMLPIPTGIYDLQINNPRIQENKNKDGFNLVLELTPMNRPDLEGARAILYTSVKMLTQIKRICLSAGLPVAGQSKLDVAALDKKVIKVAMKTGMYEDPQTHVKKETSNVDTIFIPGDPEYGAAA